MGVVVCVWMRDKGQVVGSKVVVASTQATVVAAVEQVTQKRIQVQLCCCVTRNEEDTRNSPLSRMGLSSFFNISDSEHNPVHIHYYTLLNPSLPPPYQSRPSRLCTPTERSTKSASASPSRIGLGPITKTLFPLGLQERPFPTASQARTGVVGRPV